MDLGEEFVKILPNKEGQGALRTPYCEDLVDDAFTFHSDALPIGEIDIVFHLPVPYGELKERAAYLEVQGCKVPVVSIQDLIRLKLHSGREQDLADVEHLKRVMEIKNDGR